ncbi:MAG: hypothetical protein JWO11_4492 [Nocardioides sp.]|nr:hypothetical protein [Nocardioides sp.]
MSNLGEYAESIRIEVRFADRAEIYELKSTDAVKVRSQINIAREPVEVDTGLSFRTFEPSPEVGLKLDATGGELTATRIKP